MKRANVSRDIFAPAPVCPTRTQWGVARNFPAVTSSRVSPVWKARQSGGIETFVRSPPRVLIYKPDDGEGEGVAVGSFPASSRRNIA